MLSCSPVFSDLVVIGGGITGLGIARLAARNGYACTVIERGDLAAGASSNSSHMLHGGLRYLEHGRFELVRESLRERIEVARMAPALTRPRRFLVPLYRGGALPAWKLRAAFLLYDRLAGRGGLSKPAMVRRAEALAIEPDLEPEGLRGAGLYSDVVMDDARLAIAVARDAAAHGAAIHTYTEVTGARTAEDGTIELRAVDRLDGGERMLRARVVVNASGPWVDEVRTRLLRSLAPGRPDPLPILRPSRGVHLVFPALTRGHGLLLTAASDGRVFFVVPFGEHSLVGTTEVEVPSPPPPGADRPSVEEVRYLRSELGQVMPGRSAMPPLAVLSGLRPLLRSAEDVGQSSREHGMVEEHGILSIAGGKYTTFRVMARDVLRRVARTLRTEGRRIVDPAEPLPPPLAPGASPERIGEFAAQHEFARRLADVLRRRSTLWLAPDRGRIAGPRVASGMGVPLGWSVERAREELRSYDAALWEEESLLQRAGEEAA